MMQTSRFESGARLGACIAVVTAAMLAAGCGRGPGDSAVAAALDVEQPAGWDRDLALAEPQDINPDPDIVEIELEAKLADIEVVPGVTTRAWTYDGTLPGPLIRAKVGDRVIVHFTNSLPGATSIHWHGLRVANDMDGVPGVTQEPVAAGGQFRYEFVVRDAGTFWYHPHINSAAQVGWGLYGAMIVEDPDDPPAFGDDLVLVFSDMGLDEDGGFQAVDAGGAFGDLFGREGNVLLVNGKVLPRLQVRAGKQQRWRIINAARSRYYTIGLSGHRLIRLGGDNGLAERSSEVDRIVLVPGERADLVFTPSDEPGTSRTLKWTPTERGFGSTFSGRREDMMTIETVDARPVVPEPIPEFLREIEPIDIEGAVELSLDLTIDIDANEQVVMGVNGRPHWNGEPIQARVGETHVWTVVNDTDFAHPFHLHGFFFQVLDPTRVPEWKDTVDVPAHSEPRLAVEFDERPGVWMYHCHILDHAQVGMMGHIRLDSAVETAAPAVPASVPEARRPY